MPEGERLSFSIILPLRNEAELDQLLGRLYEPSSPDYRQFLGVADFTERFGPTAENYAAVVAFARANGLEVTEAPANRLIVPVSGPVAAINHAFHVRMSLYQHPTENRIFFSPDREPSLTLSVPVAHLAGLNNYSLPKPMVKRASDRGTSADVTGSGPGGSYLASDMRAAYYGATQLTGDGQAVGLLEFGGYYRSDVNLTFSTAGQSYAVPINNVLLDGASPEPIGGQSDIEQVLDIVQAIGMAPGLSQVRVYIGKSNGVSADDASVLNAMASENLAKTLSCSWGWIPDDPATDDVFFKEFAAQGQSFFAASGDSGAFDAAINPYFYPGEDAYVTAVGGTHLTTQSAGGPWEAEAAWNNPPDGSGGGVSPDGIPIPSWQSGLATSANRGSTTTRNVPDVAMEADFDNYSCGFGECGGGYAGTSFAAPRWAAFTALVNQQAVEAGTAPKGGVGFLNPSIYSIGKGSNYADDFHDIVSGTNLTDRQPNWFSAETGYDLVTGWGSATGQDLINDLAGKQIPGFWLSASSPIVMNPGASGSTTITVTDAGGFTGKVQLAITSKLPSGVTAKWGTNSASGSVLTLTAASTAANVTTPVTITGTSGSISQETQIALTVHTPSFSISALPRNLAMGPSTSTSVAVLVTPLYGFNGNVKLAISGLPKGVTATLGTNPATGVNILTLAASSSAAVGTSNITITGTSGSIKVSATLALTIHLPAFVLSSYGEVNIGPGTSGGMSIWILGEYGFSGPVKLYVTGLPEGVTASFSANPTRNGYSLLTLAADSSTALGSSTLTVTGVSGKLKVTTSFKLNILAPTFALSADPEVSIGRGMTTSASVYVDLEYGFSHGVNLSLSGLPSCVTASLSPNPSIGQTTILLTASSCAALGTSTITITGTFGSLKQTTTFELGVYLPTFTLSASETATLGQGSSSSNSILVNPEYGFDGSVTLSVSGLPRGVTASFSPNPVTGVAALSLTASDTAQVGNSTLTITGVSGTQTAKTTFPLEVAAPSFTLAGPSAVSVGTGTSTSANVSITPEYGFLGSVDLRLSELPSGVTASFSPNPTIGSSLLTLTSDTTAKVANSTIKLVGVSGSKTAVTTVALTVTAPSFMLSGSGSIELGQGTSQTTNINLSPQNGFTGNVLLAVSGLPAGVTASFEPDLITQASTLTLNASSTAKAGTSTITVIGTSGAQKATTTIPLTVAIPAFTLNLFATVLVPGGEVSTAVYVNPEFGFTGSVQLSATGLPAGVKASFSPNPTTGYDTLTLTASSLVASGNKTVTIKGTSGSVTVTAPLTLTISKNSLNLSGPSTVELNPGSFVTAYINANTTPGSVVGSVQFAVSGLPSGVTASFSPNPAVGSSLLTLTAAKNAGQESTNLTITGTLGKLSGSTTVQLQVHSPAFTLSTPSNVTIGQGGTVSSYFDVDPDYGFTGAVNFSVSGLPAGVTASWAPNPATYNSTLTITASPTAPINSAAVTVTGTSGSLSASTTFQLTVVPPSFTINPFSVSINRGTSTSTDVYVDPLNGFNGNVNLAITGLPSGVTGSFSPSPTNSPSTLTLTASDSATLGQYNAVVTGTYGKVTASSQLNVTVTSNGPAFTLSVNGSTQLGRGTSASVPVSVNTQNGPIGSVLLSAKNLPSGVTATFLPNPTASGSTMTLTASDGAVLGGYIATIVGTYSKQTASSPFSVSVYEPTFTLYNYSSLLVNPGSSGQTDISVYPSYGFLGSVQLSASSLPSGVTASFSPNPVTNESVMTVTANKSVGPGQYNLTVKGVSGERTATTLAQLTIAAPNFTLSCNGASLGQGESTTAFVNFNSNYGFNDAVELTVTGLPSGITASFSPNPTTYSSNIILTATKSVRQGGYTFTIIGNGGGQTASTQCSIIVGPPSFNLWGPGEVQLGQGGSASISVGLNSQYGFSGNVELSVTGLPSGVTPSFSPNPMSASSTLTLKASSSAPAGTYNVSVIGVSGTQSSSAPFTVQIGEPSFTLFGSNTLSLGQGTSSTANISVNPSFGFDGTVHFSASGLPSGMTAAFSPPSASGGTNLTLTAANTVPTGNYAVTVSGVSGARTATTQISVTVGTPSFSISSYGSLQVGQGSSAETSVSVNSSFGFAGNVELNASGLPTGVTASFSPDPTSYFTSLTVSASNSVKSGQYNITITGTSGSQSQSISVPLNVYPPTFSIFASGAVSVGRGSSTNANVVVNSQYGSPSVHFAVSGLPDGVKASFSSNPSTNGSTLVLTASSTASLGEYSVTVTGTSGSVSASATLALTVYAPTFTISSNGSMNLGLGTSTTTSVYVEPEYGFAGSVHFTASSLPSGITAAFSPNPATGSTMLTLTATSTASLGEYNILLTGSSGSQSASTILNVTVYVPTFTISGSYNVNIGQGTSTTTSINVYPEYGFAGSVRFAASGLPGGVTASFSPNQATNSTILTLTASDTAGVGTYNITITGTSGSQSASTTLALGVFVPGFTMADYGIGPLSASGSVISYVYITDEYGFTGDIQLTVSGLPSGVMASFSPNPATTSSALTLNAGSSVKAGQYSLTIAGVSGTHTASTSVGLTIN